MLPSAPSTNSQCYAGFIPLCFPFWAKHRLFWISFPITQNGFFSTESSSDSSAYTDFDAFYFLIPPSLHTCLALSTSLTAFWVTQVSPDDACLKLTVIGVDFVDCFEKEQRFCPASFKWQVETGREKDTNPDIIHKEKVLVHLRTGKD